jgi:hypothetical protein
MLQDLTDPNIYRNFVGMVFELVIIILSIIILVLILQKYLKKRHKLTRLLLFIFINYTLAIVFSWLSKVFVIVGFNLETLDPVSAWFLYRIADFRLSEFIVTIAIFLSYILKVQLFQEEYNQLQKYVIIIYGIFASVYTLFIYQRGNAFLDIFAFLIVFIYMLMIYLPFLRRTFEFYREVEKGEFKSGFLGLMIMSIGFIFIFLSFALDRILILLGEPGFTFFYFAAWSSGIIGILGAYLGYIRPKASK